MPCHPGSESKFSTEEAASPQPATRIPRATRSTAPTPFSGCCVGIPNHFQGELGEVSDNGRLTGFAQGDDDGLGLGYNALLVGSALEEGTCADEDGAVVRRANGRIGVALFEQHPVHELEEFVGGGTRVHEHFAGTQEALFDGHGIVGLVALDEHIGLAQAPGELAAEHTRETGEVIHDGVEVGRFQTECEGRHDATHGGGAKALAKVGHFTQEDRRMGFGIDNRQFIAGGALPGGVRLLDEAMPAQQQKDILLFVKQLDSIMGLLEML